MLEMIQNQTGRILGYLSVLGTQLHQNIVEMVFVNLEKQYIRVVQTAMLALIHQRLREVRRSQNRDAPAPRFDRDLLAIRHPRISGLDRVPAANRYQPEAFPATLEKRRLVPALSRLRWCPGFSGGRGGRRVDELRRGLCRDRTPRLLRRRRRNLFLSHHPLRVGSDPTRNGRGVRLPVMGRLRPDRQSWEPPAASLTDCLPAEMNGIMARSSWPTASIGWVSPALRSRS